MKDHPVRVMEMAVFFCMIGIKVDIACGMQRISW